MINNFETFDIKILIVTVFFASMPFTNIEVLATMFRYYGHIAPKTLNFLAFYFILFFYRTCWKLFQKHVVRTKFDIYVFIVVLLSQ